MKKEKNNKFLVAVVALVLLGVSVGYALISRTYQFNGTANVGGNTWNLEDPNPGDIEVDPESKPPTPPTVDCTTENGVCKITYTANLEKPGDFYEFTTPIKNSGSIEAKLESATLTKDLTTEQKEYLKYTVVDADTGSPLVEGQPLAANGGIINVKVRVEYRNDDAVDTSKYPTEAVSGIQLGCEIKFVQDVA